MRWGFDIDGVIGTNPCFFSWFTYLLEKNNQAIYIISSRNPKRRKETVSQLEKWGIPTSNLIMMPRDAERDYRTQGAWKAKTVAGLDLDIWFDNDFKVYERVYGLSLDNLVPGVERILV